MLRKLTLLLTVLLLLVGNQVKADEGMWIPMLLKKYNIEDMQKAGFKLTAEDIYDVNQACLKDAVIGLGREGRPFHHFCTGELISDQGLVVTNHHCGYGAIQAHSTLEHDYLKDGFWAKNKGEELVNEGITASFFIRMADVTAEVLKGINDDTKEVDRSKIIKENIKKIEAEAEKNTDYRASVKAYFAGNQYFLSVYEIFKDIRLVGAPPSAIGKFGGDTDNWMWPRHTGDFSMFRIYANKDNKPASYSKDNVPMQPKKSFKISLKGVKEGDFTMVFGYPGTTTEYLTSSALEMMTQVDNPNKIKLRTKKLDLMRADMDASPMVRIQYSAKYAGVANSWKRWQGEIKGLNRLNAIAKKKELEARFEKWANSDAKLKAKYAGIVSQMKDIYEEMTPYSLARDYAIEAGLSGSEVVTFAGNFRKLVSLDKKDTEAISKEVKVLQKKATSFYKNYNKATDQKLLGAMMSMYFGNVEAKFQPEELKVIAKKFKGDFKAYAKKTMAKSVLANQVKLESLLANYKASNANKIAKDPAYILAMSILDLYKTGISPKYSELKNKADMLQRTYMAGLMAMDSDKVFYPDANSTFRVHYGKVAGYKARNAVTYDYYTTLEGIIEKDNPNIFDYDVPQKLRDLYASRDYGRYGEAGQMNVCFAATNHTTGGNSGSPVLNANGELLGLNFDRSWEGVMSDLMYDPSICRNVSLDIRYVLFIVDKFAGAGYLIDEMNIVE
ncbi:S46 family peptidase [Ancylomarina sp. 16SWW S1-10-2]|uniref:S46 family peptidase n=1 Tax=Ancylomarina sp. 16SWW S1-10-2 TaxID=2499681 RepID=UPI0012ADADC1|nr:S46 family peptidase [Ancylomarina sp. 16SWW S1-10-2]MRT94009.1 S46 family peptidase [Ancylomarina sp. 16SWW S1-10-2]